MQNFDYCTSTRLIFGKGVIEKLPEILAPIGKISPNLARCNSN